MITTVEVFKSTRRKAEEVASGLLMIVIAYFFALILWKARRGK